jgi:hypothetical protein
MPFLKVSAAGSRVEHFQDWRRVIIFLGPAERGRQA